MKNFILPDILVVAIVLPVFQFLANIIWDQLLKNGQSKICGRKPLKTLKRYGLLTQIISFKIFQKLSPTNFT